MCISGIYQIRSISKPDKLYIGSAVDISKRWTGHKWRLENHRHENSRLQRHYDKYGIDDFIFSIKITCDKDSLIQHEQFFIDSLNPWFNICKIADSKKGVPCSQETKEKISRANKGRKCSPETIAKMKKRVPWNKGLKGAQVAWFKDLPKELHPQFGKKNSEETRKKKSDKLKGRPVSQKTLDQFEINRKKGNTKEANEKKGRKGRKQSKEWVAKRVAAVKRFYQKEKSS